MYRRATETSFNARESSGLLNFHSNQVKARSRCRGLEESTSLNFLFRDHFFIWHSRLYATSRSKKSSKYRSFVQLYFEVKLPSNSFYLCSHTRFSKSAVIPTYITSVMLDMIYVYPPASGISCCSMASIVDVSAQTLLSLWSLDNTFLMRISSDSHLKQISFITLRQSFGNYPKFWTNKFVSLTQFYKPEVRGKT